MYSYFHPIHADGRIYSFISIWCKEIIEIKSYILSESQERWNLSKGNKIQLETLWNKHDALY